MFFLKELYSKTILANIIPHGTLRKEYYFRFGERRPSPAVVFSLDARYFEMGWADVLRGVLSAFAFAKAKRLPFYIDFKTPFILSDYLVPNKCDWRVYNNLICSNLRYVTTLWLLDYDKGRVCLLPFPSNRQYHFFTNVDVIGIINKKYKKTYCSKDLYQELFKPSPSLQKHIDVALSEIGGDYISVSFRFTTLLGDFHDCINQELPEAEKQTYINKCHQLLKNLHDKYPLMKILVTSDSQKFIESIHDIGWTYSLSGKRSQFNNGSSDDSTLNTFLDFILISRAQRVYMAHTGLMYRSKFSQSAAMTTGVPFEEMAF